MAIELSREQQEETDIGTTEKPSRIEKIKSALTEIENGSTIPECVAATPGAFLWEFYKAWVENGGQDGGKNRNSIRRMRDVWLTGEHEVKSLHPKLTGKVRISKDDAKSLMTLFLGRWKFVGVKEDDWVLTADGYAPFPCKDCRKLCETLADAMYPEGIKSTEAGLILPTRSGASYPGETNSGWSDVEEVYNSADAVINFSRHRAALGATPPETMRFFWHLFKNFYDTMRTKVPIFIYIIDIGSRQVEDEEAWAEFYNFEMLKAQFRSFATFDSIHDVEHIEDKGKNPHNDTDKTDQRSDIHDAFLRSLAIPEETHHERRWRWLCDNTVILIQNLRKEEFGDLYCEEDEGVEKIRLKDIGVTAENILPKMLPYNWSKHRYLRELYGPTIDNVADATLTAFFKRDGWTNSSTNQNRHRDMRYFAHALMPKPEKAEHSDVESVAISREIDTPGELYDEAFRIVYWAARHRLTKQDQWEDRDPAWAIAVAYLRNQGFQILRLSEFLTIHRTPHS